MSDNFENQIAYRIVVLIEIQKKTIEVFMH